MFNNDTAAARGRMATKGLYIFSHDTKRGNAPSHKLFSRIREEKREGKKNKDESARSYSDYKIHIDEEGLEALNIKLKKLVHEEETLKGTTQND